MEFWQTQGRIRQSSTTMKNQKMIKEGAAVHR
jgi:hypothetical protein